MFLFYLYYIIKYRDIQDINIILFLDIIINVYILHIGENIMQKFKKDTIFDLLNEPTYNIFFDEIQDPEEALYWQALRGNFTAQKFILQKTDPATWDDKSKEYKEKIAKKDARPVLIDINELFTKEELKEYKEMNESEQEEYLNLKWRERNQ